MGVDVDKLDQVAVVPNFETKKSNTTFMTQLSFCLLLRPKFSLAKGSVDLYLQIISLLAKLHTLTWKFHRITRFGNIEIVINREKYLKILCRRIIKEAGKLLQGYMDGKKSSKEDSRQDEIRCRNGYKRIIAESQNDRGWKGPLGII